MLRKRALWTRVARWSEGLREAHADLEQGLAGKKHEHDEQIVERLATAFNNATTDFDKRTFLQFAADLPEAGIGGTSVLSVWRCGEGEGGPRGGRSGARRSDRM